jgi:5-methylcytosine-specific restriction endonuclease McrA
MAEVTRQQAKAHGLTRYFGKPCAKHPELKGERQIANSGCPKCQRAKESKESRLTRTRRYRWKNREYLVAQCRTWRNNNKEYFQVMNRAWRQANSERVAANWHARRARKRAAPGRWTKADIQRLWGEQNGVCAAPHCSTLLEISCTVDHKIPLSRGGSNWPANLQLLCSSCNSSKCDRTMDEWFAVLDTRREPCFTCETIEIGPSGNVL